MKARNKDGTRTLEWLNKRKEDLKRTKSVSWYLKLKKQTPQFRSELTQKYNKYLEETLKSPAYDVFQAVKEAYSSGDRKLFDEMVEVARQKLINEDFQKPPALYDPSVIEYDFFVKQYLEVVEEIDKQEGGFKKMVEEELI